MQDAAIQIAETIQTAHINRAPSPRHDLNPSTAASRKQPVELISSPAPSDVVSDVGEDEVPLSVLRPVARKAQMPPLPDLRFEQSYLASIKDAPNWQMVGYITLRDQILMPLFQGVAWTLIVSGWRHWNKTAAFSGQSVGGKIRRWWWGVNNWKLPADARGTLRDEKLARDAQDFYQVISSNAGAD